MPAAAASGPAPGGRRPLTVTAAAWLMYAGAAVAVLSLALTLLSAGAMRAAAHKAYPHWSAPRLSGYVHAQVTAAIIQVALEVALWLLIAWACRAGRPWGRLAGTGLLILDSLLLIPVLLKVGVAAGLAVSFAMWALGLAAVILLWQRPSSAFFTADREPPGPLPPARPARS